MRHSDTGQVCTRVIANKNFSIQIAKNLIVRITQKVNMIISHNSTVEQRKYNLDRDIDIVVI